MSTLRDLDGCELAAAIFRGGGRFPGRSVQSASISGSGEYGGEDEQGVGEPNVSSNGIDGPVCCGPR